MNTRIVIGVLSIVIIFFGIFLMNDYLPPRTPIKVARIQSGLKLSKSATVIDFKENYTFTGEGEIEIKLRIDSSEVETIKNECIQSNFKKLTIDNLIEDGFLNTDPQVGFNMPNTDLRKIKNGYYKLNVNDFEKLDFTITVLNLDKNELSIWTLVP